MNRIALVVIGFALFIMGFLALILGFIGLGLWPISFFDENGSPIVAFGVKMLMVVLGLVLLYIGRMPPEEA